MFEQFTVQTCPWTPCQCSAALSTRQASVSEGVRALMANVPALQLLERRVSVRRRQPSLRPRARGACSCCLNFENFHSCLANELALSAPAHTATRRLTWYSILGSWWAVWVLRCLNPASLHHKSRSRSKAENREPRWNVGEKYTILLRHCTTTTSQEVVPNCRRLAVLRHELDFFDNRHKNIHYNN